MEDGNDEKNIAVNTLTKAARFPRHDHKAGERNAREHTITRL